MPSEHNHAPETSKVASERPLSHSEARSRTGGECEMHPETRTLDHGYIFTRIFARASRALDSPDS